LIGCWLKNAVGGVALTPETQQKLLKAENRMLTDLQDWLARLGVSESEVVAIYRSIVRENGIAAKLFTGYAANAIPLSTKVPVKPENFDQELRRIRSPEYASWLLSQPEPTPEILAELLDSCRSALPNLRQHFFQSAKLGPRHKRGGRPEELADPKVRREIREKIKSLRGPGVELQDLFRRLA
jgi:hypothetical protein